MKVLVIGNGGREHALAWKLSHPSDVNEVFVAPGNAGTAQESKLTNIDIEATNIEALLTFAQSKQIDLTLVGPEAPLVAGIVDQFLSAGLACFGPSKQAAQLEGSKTFSKDFLQRHNIPTAQYASFSDYAKAITYVQQVGAPIVIKADGLAAGKGVIIAHTLQHAIDAIEMMLAGNKFGEAGHRVVIEEFLTGEEASFIVMADGKHCLPLATSQDHKARDNGDTGPNTGGMGAYSPAPVITPQLHQCIMQDIIAPTIDGMAAEGMPYTGFLYAGIMVTPEGIPKVLEFNCRLGDPETQPIMMRMRSGLLPLLQAALTHKLDTVSAEWDPRTAVGVVLAAGGYPNHYRKGDIIQGLPTQPNDAQKVFHAGTKIENHNIVTAGGRVLCATALGETIASAQQAAYQLTKQIHWQDVYYRTDIGHRALTETSNPLK